MMVEKKRGRKAAPKQQTTVQFNTRDRNGNVTRRTGRLVKRNALSVWVGLSNLVGGERIIHRHIRKHNVTWEGGEAL